MGPVLTGLSDPHVTNFFLQKIAQVFFKICSFLNGVYLTLQIEDFLFGTAENNSDIAQVVQVGYSYEGRPSYVFHVRLIYLVLIFDLFLF